MEGRKLQSSKDGASKGREWENPSSLCVIDDIDIRMAITELMAILKEIKVKITGKVK